MSVYSLRDPQAQDSKLAGGKASALAQLIVAGFPVPEGFVVVSSQDADLAAQYRSLEDGGPWSFAVRSSGFAEDSAAASFAGQFETFLGVRGLPDVTAKIARCFESFSNARSATYRESRNAGDLGGAVIVQRLVEAEAAGIAFSVDPITGADSRVLIESNFGLGESVVSGRVTPDTFAVEKETRKLAERRIGDKIHHTVLAEGGSRIEELSPELSSRPSLSDEAVRAVADLVCRVERHYGRPVDVEWAWQGNKVHLLQARPVTAIGKRSAIPPPPPADWVPELNTAIDPRFPLYANGNVSEILPGCVTPLTYSVFSRVEKAFRSLTEYVGSMPDVGPKPIVVGFFYHRVYLNASYFMEAADNSPGASRDTVYEDLIGPSPTHHPAWEWRDLLPWNALRGLRLIARYLGLQGQLAADIAKVREFYDGHRKAIEERPPDTWSHEELAAWIECNDEDLLPLKIHIRASQFANSSFTTLRSLTKNWLGDAQGVLASNLLTGIGGLASVSPSMGLYELAHIVKCDPKLRALFKAEPDDRRLAVRFENPQTPGERRFCLDLELFANVFGHRGFREAELRNPCWREDPAAVISHVRKHLEPGTTSPEEIAQRQTALYEQARKDALARLSGVKRAFFVSVLDGARKHIGAREEMKDLLLLVMDLMRRVLSAAQWKLENVLGDPGDIYFLLDTELAAVLRGTRTPEAARDIVKRRRLDFERASRVYVSRIQDGSARFLEKPEGYEAGPELSGVPVSPGHVEGRARVVLEPADAKLAEGEILVAPVTDVAWTPLFLRAAGLVVEVGGPLSHGSIVAREYGIPAVTAVAGATTRIRTGDWLRVDGDRGVVVIVGQGVPS